MNLAIKYDFASIKNDIVAKMKSEWPTTLYEWDDLSDQTEKYRSRFDADEHPAVPVDEAFPEPASAIQFAKDFDIPEILPAAFYNLSCLHVMLDWFRNRERPDEYKNWTSLTARWSDLGRDDLFVLMHGKCSIQADCEDAAEEDWRDVLEDIPGWDGIGCDCSDEISDEAWDNVCGEIAASDDPLAVSKSILDDSTGETCPFCEFAMRRALRRLRQTIWDSLPSAFSYTHAN